MNLEHAKEIMEEIMSVECPDYQFRMPSPSLMHVEDEKVIGMTHFYPKFIDIDEEYLLNTDVFEVIDIMFHEVAHAKDCNLQREGKVPWNHGKDCGGHDSIWLSLFTELENKYLKRIPAWGIVEGAIQYGKKMTEQRSSVEENKSVIVEDYSINLYIVGV